MQRIAFLIGVRGAGKSTLLASLRKHSKIEILKPTTNRPKRSASEEYEFVEEFPHGNSMKWVIKVGEYKYGVTGARIRELPDGLVGVTVFDPDSISVIEHFRQRWTGEVVTIGLDTIMTVEEQNVRVQHDPIRTMKSGDFERQREQVLQSDIVLSGDAELVKNAAIAVCEILLSRGGMVGKSWLAPLISAGALLDNAQVDGIQPASYDLRLGSEVWCQGKRHELTEQEPFFKIPPYSYAIVKAQEVARIPGFMAGRFDLTVSLFFKGVLLSNGPQVDPGYEGALFCTLFNGRDVHAELKRGAHFATIEFCTLGNCVDGYNGPYQRKNWLNDFLLAETGTGPGGDIIGRIDKLDAQLGEVRTSTAKYWGTMVGIFVTVLGLAFTVQMFVLNSLKGQFEKSLDQMVLDAEGNLEVELDRLSRMLREVRARVTERTQEVDEVSGEISELIQRLESLQNKLDSIEERSSGSSAKVPSDFDDESSMLSDPPSGL